MVDILWRDDPNGQGVTVYPQSEKAKAHFKEVGYQMYPSEVEPLGGYGFWSWKDKAPIMLREFGFTSEKMEVQEGIDLLYTLTGDVLAIFPQSERARKHFATYGYIPELDGSYQFRSTAFRESEQNGIWDDAGLSLTMKEKE